jgi:acetolactate synthase-1/3 small subunit
MLVKIKTSTETREEIKRTTDIFRGSIIDVTAHSYVVEMTGPSDKLDAFLAAIDKDNIIEVVRSGTTGISRGEKGLHL